MIYPWGYIILSQQVCEPLSRLLRLVSQLITLRDLHLARLGCQMKSWQKKLLLVPLGDQVRVARGRNP